MSTSTNTGHAKNVANFEILITNITALGVAYNPSKELLTLLALNAKLTASKDALTAVNAIEPAYENAVDDRMAAFKPFSKLITRVNSAVKVSDVSDEFQASVLTLVRLLQGRRAKAIKEDGPEENHISASHMSYDSRIENFDKLIKLLESAPAYAPNEPMLQTVALTELYNNFVTLNTAVITSEIPLNNARIERNNILYTLNTGLVDIVLDVKMYVKSIFGSSSPQFKAISGLRFSSPKRN